VANNPPPGRYKPPSLKQGMTSGRVYCSEQHTMTEGGAPFVWRAEPCMRAKRGGLRFVLGVLTVSSTPTPAPLLGFSCQLHIRYRAFLCVVVGCGKTTDRVVSGHVCASLRLLHGLRISRDAVIANPVIRTCARGVVALDTSRFDTRHAANGGSREKTWRVCCCIYTVVFRFDRSPRTPQLY